jgi:RNA polymerase sigma-70 factor, ECF subfamily
VVQKLQDSRGGSVVAHVSSLAEFRQRSFGKREHDEFTTLYERYVSRIYRFIFSHVGNRTDAEDVTSEVFVKVYRNLGRFEGRGSLEGWLFQIARTAVADYWRQRYKLDAIPLDGFDFGDSDAVPATVDDQVREDRVAKLLSQLPAKHQDVLRHRFFLHCTIAQTAASMGISQANVKVLQYRALHRAAEVAKGMEW